MCDTFIALPSVTYTGNLLLSKNSDREPDEAQALLHVPRRQNQEEFIQCTYITIPQVKESFECILSKPFEMWGAEMGVNEFGVSIGNEAVFTKVKFAKKNEGLTGMDMLRLALERSRTAAEAIDCITSLLEQYGQDACGGYKNKSFFYHNSFIIADCEGGWVLDTAGREWAVQQVKDLRSISNRLSIANADRLSSTAMSTAKSKGWWKGELPFNFQQAYSDWFFTRMGRAASREACTTQASLKKAGTLTAYDCMQILQTHNLDEQDFKPRKATTGSVCMHATSILNPSQTTGSMVAEIRRDQRHTIWLTGTSMPCLSVYIPFFFGTSVLQNFRSPSGQPDNSFWWRAERIHQWICKDYQNRKARINEERQQLQDSFLEKERRLMSERCTLFELENFSKECLIQMEECIARWDKLI